MANRLKVIECIRTCLSNDKISEEDKLIDLKIDSITIIYLFTEIENIFGISIPMEYLDYNIYSAISDIIDIVVSTIENKCEPISR